MVDDQTKELSHEHMDFQSKAARQCWGCLSDMCEQQEWDGMISNWFVLFLWDVIGSHLWWQLLLVPWPAFSRACSTALFKYIEFGLFEETLSGPWLSWRSFILALALRSSVQGSTLAPKSRGRRVMKEEYFEKKKNCIGQSSHWNMNS